MIDAVPTSVCSVVAEAVAGAGPTCFLGIIVHGKQDAVETFEHAAAARRISVGRVGPDKAGVESMAVFNGTGAVEAFALLRDARDGRLGRLAVEIIVAPAALAQDGIDLDREAKVTDPAYLIEPKE